MAEQLTVLFSLAVGAFIVVAFGVPLSQQSLPPPEELFPLGNIYGKDYYAVYNLSMNWEEAGAYCQRHNLTLGTIRTEYEVKFLRVELNQRHLPKVEFWTAARESRYFAEAFRWNDTGGIEVESGFFAWNMRFSRFDEVPYATCAIFLVQKNLLGFYGVPCSDQVQGTLCESPQEQFLSNKREEIRYEPVLNRSHKVETSETSGASERRTKPGQLTLMGSVEDKDYYEVDGLPMNWYDAGLYCHQYNLTLATIQTQVQVEFLESAYSDLGLERSLEFWTAARDGRYYFPAFRWDDTDETIEFMYSFWAIDFARFENFTFQTCATFQVTSLGLMEMESAPCRDVVQGTLCETPPEPELPPNGTDVMFLWNQN